MGRMVAIGLAIVAVPAVAATSAAAPQTESDATFAVVRQVDAAMARIGFRLATANAVLCDQREPGFGMLLHVPVQYARSVRADARRYFAFDGPVGIEAVIAGSPAATAGLREDDTLLKIGTVRFGPDDAGDEGEASTAPLVRIAERIATLDPDRPVEVAGRRDGAAFVRTVDPMPACRVRFEVAIGSGYLAKGDDALVQLGSQFFERFPEEQVAAVVAHELAHTILRHRERLEARDVSYGLLSGFGRNVRYFRQTEIEADILSVSLLVNAGYDPRVAVRFWQVFGPDEAGGLLRSRSHPAWRDRIATIEHAIASVGTARPARPAILDARDRPLDGDWQSLLVRARDD